jgi:photosystem II stability/assembly factor-like uncharacterized protein
MKYLILILFLVFYFLSENLESQTLWEQTGEIDCGRIFCLTNNSSNHIYAATDSGIFRSSNNGDLWVQCGLQQKTVFTSVISAEGYIYVGAEDGFYISNDSGNDWQKIGLVGQHVNALALNSVGTIFAGIAIGDTFETGAYRSIDNGITWTKINNGLTRPSVQALAINSNNEIFAATAGIPSDICRSVDNGDNWTQVHSSGAFSLFIAPNDYIFAGNTGILRSTDNGSNWNYVIMMPVYPNAFDVSYNGQLFCGTGFDGFFNYGGVFTSGDNGDSWYEINHGVVGDDRDIFALNVNSDSVIYIGTRYSKIFKATQSITSIRKNNLVKPYKFLLYQNYPNPFNSETKIDFKLSECSDVNFEFFNSLGQIVYVDTYKNMNAGSHSIIWSGINNEGKELASGIYFYKITINNKYILKKLLFIK